MYLALLLSAFAHAGSDDAAVNPFQEPDESELFRLDEQLVTVASRYAQTLRKAPSIVSLVTADDIRTRGYRTVADVLRDLPGIYVWKSQEGRDVATFRGVVSADNNKVLLMVDGVPWYDGVYTHAFLDDYLPVSHIKQVEVIKGPGSAVYGTNAFSGVVNIVTWDGADVDGARARLTVGSGGRMDATAVVGGRDDIGGIDVSASGYVRMLGQRGDGLDVTPSGGRDILGFDRKEGVSVGARVHVGDLRLQLHHTDYAHAFLINDVTDPVAVTNKDLDEYGLFYRDTFFEARYRYDAGDVVVSPHVWSQRHDDPGAYYNQNGLDTWLDEDGLHTAERFTIVETEKDSRRGGGGVDFEARPEIDHVTVGGVGVENTRVLSLIDREFVDGAAHGTSTGFEAPSRALLVNAFAYAQHTWTALPELEVTGGGRFDLRLPPINVEGAGDWNAPPSFSPRLGVLWVPSEAVTAKLLYGHAFRAPNVRELLVEAPFDGETGRYAFASGNLDVGPETIDTVEAQLTLAPSDAVEATLGGSYSLLSREIDKVITETEPFRYRNLTGGLSIAGAEAGVKAELEPVTVTAAYALTLARYLNDDQNPYAGRPQYEFPTHMLKGRVHTAITDNLSATMLGELYSERPRSAWSPNAGMEDGAPFGLLHLAVRAANLGKNDRAELGVSLRNLLDTAWGTGVYRDDADEGAPGAPVYPGPMEGEGRSVNVSLEFAL